MKRLLLLGLLCAVMVSTHAVPGRAYFPGPPVLCNPTIHSFCYRGCTSQHENCHGHCFGGGWLMTDCDLDCDVQYANCNYGCDYDSCVPLI